MSKYWTVGHALSNHHTVKYALSNYQTVGHPLSNHWTVGLTLSSHWTMEYALSNHPTIGHALSNHWTIGHTHCLIIGQLSIQFRIFFNHQTLEQKIAGYCSNYKYFEGLCRIFKKLFVRRKAFCPIAPLSAL